MSLSTSKTISRICILGTVCAAPFLFTSSACYAEYIITKKVELKCGKSFLRAPSFEQDGNPYVRYVATSIGVREKGFSDIIKVKRNVDDSGNIMDGGSGLSVHINASCSGDGLGEGIAVSGTSHSCKKGEGIRLKLHKPNDPDSDKFHGVVELTEIWDSKEELIRAVEVRKAKLEEQIVEQVEALAPTINEVWNEAMAKLDAKTKSAQPQPRPPIHHSDCCSVL